MGFQVVPLEITLIDPGLHATEPVQAFFEPEFSLEVGDVEGPGDFREPRDLDGPGPHLEGARVGPNEGYVPGVSDELVVVVDPGRDEAIRQLLVRDNEARVSGGRIQIHVW